MIVSAVNDFVWSELQKDAALSAQYDKYRAKYGPNFKPFFPVADNHAGDASWGSECYVLWDSMITRPNRPVFLERHAQILYTVVGPLPALFEFTDAIANSFDFWQSTTFNGAGYRVNDIDAWQPDRIRGRDSLRQTYSSSLILEVHYLTC